jgi:hypothetical protein
MMTRQRLAAPVCFKSSMKDMVEARKSVPARHVAAVVLGNALEFYDFLTYSFFAVYIGRTFFPSSDPAVEAMPKRRRGPGT